MNNMPDDYGNEYRLPPHNMNAEQGLLGAILVDNRAHEVVSEFLRPDHFMVAGHIQIYEVMDRMITDGQTANPITMRDYLKGSDVEQSYLGELAANAITVLNAPEYARIVIENFRRRELIQVGAQVINSAHDDTSINAADIIENLERDLTVITDGGGTNRVRSTLDMANAAFEEMEAAFKRQGALAGLSTGLPAIDKLTMGLRDGNFIILAGRPGMGKTTLAMTIAYKLSLAHSENPEEGAPIGVFSKEMTGEELIQRLAAQATSISLDSILLGEYHNDTEAHRAFDAVREIGKLPLYIDDSAGLTTQAIRSRARTMIRKHGVKMIIIDHMGRIRPDNPKASATEQTSQIALDLKNIAKDLGIPVVAICQLSRGVEQRDDKRPTLSDLRQSGRIEEEADVVLMVYRAEYYLQKEEPVQGKEGGEKFAERLQNWSDQLEASRGKAQVIAEKMRQGRPGVAYLGFEGKYSRFINLTTDTQREMEY